MMFLSHLKLQLVFWSGMVTALAVVQFFIPKLYSEKMLHVKLDKPENLFYFRHWGVLSFAMGMLLMYSSFNNIMLRPVLFIAGVEKMALVALIFMDRKKAYTKQMMHIFIFDCFATFFYFYLILSN